MSIRRTYSTKDIYLASVLYDSIEDNNLSAVKSLLAEKGADPNILVPRKGISAFHLAIGTESSKFALEATTLVLQYGGNPNVRSLDGLTPIHIAAAWGRLDILIMLLHCGGDPHLRDINHMNAMDYAFEQEQDEIAKYFKENYPNVDLSVLNNKDETSPCDVVLDKILINNGSIIGEYKIGETKVPIQTSNLELLPKTNTDEYVLNWIGNTILPVKEEKSDMKTDDDLFKNTGSEDSDNNRPNFEKVTLRKRFRKVSGNKRVSPNKCLPIEENVLEGSTRRRKKKLVHLFKGSRESGIMTLPESTCEASHFQSILGESNVGNKSSSTGVSTGFSTGKSARISSGKSTGLGYGKSPGLSYGKTNELGFGITNGTSSGKGIGISSGKSTEISSGKNSELSSEKGTGLSSEKSMGLSSGICTRLNSGKCAETDTGISTGISTGVSTGISIGFRSGFKPGFGLGINSALNTGINIGLNTGINNGLNTGITNGHNSATNNELNTGLDTEINNGLANGITNGFKTGLNSEIKNSLNKEHHNGINSENINRVSVPLNAFLRPKAKDTSSDYFTCTEFSETSNILERNVFDITSDQSFSPPQNSLLTDDRSVDFHNRRIASFEKLSDVDRTFVSVSEVYKYMDAEEGVVLFEKRLLVNTTRGQDESLLSAITSHSSKLSSLPQNFDYDTDTLRKELTQSGFNPGPITSSTKRVYLKKLHRLKKYPMAPPPQEDSKKVYSKELERTLKNPEWQSDLTAYKDLDLIVSNQFSSPDPTRKWREGLNKSSFNYLLLDPRITQNLPCRADFMTPQELWETFLSAIFYVGKGKRSRPYAHLYEAVCLWNKGGASNKTTGTPLNKNKTSDTPLSNNKTSDTPLSNNKTSDTPLSKTSDTLLSKNKTTGTNMNNPNIPQTKNKKLQHILDIWTDNCGVICLHVFQNVIPVEAYTREAAMISAIRLENLKNLKTGDFYGQACTWGQNQKGLFGVYLLYRAMNILLQEGERQLSPNDID